MTCDIERCDNPDVGTIHGDGQYCIDCMLPKLGDIIRRTRMPSAERDLQTEKERPEFGSKVWALAKLANDSGVPMTLIAKELEVSRSLVQQRIQEVLVENQ